MFDIKKVYYYAKSFVLDTFSSLYSYLKRFKDLSFIVGLAAVSFLSFFGCVCVWDNHLEKVHLLEMDALEKTQLIEMELLDKKKLLKWSS